MAARERASDLIRPAVTVLQLDTAFPRVPGDVACAETYPGELEVLRVPAATVGRVVTDRPDLIDIEPFLAAVRSARGDVIVTSCGFLNHWQDVLSAATDRPVISSALQALSRFDADEVLLLTFDADSLRAQVNEGPEPFGLSPDMHLRRVISGDLAVLDQVLAAAEVVALASEAQRAHHRHMLLECTNLPPYKAALRAATGLPVTDILTEIERVRPGSVRPNFL